MAWPWAESIIGGSGNDTLEGGDDNDRLYGDSDNDTMNGGTGNDTMTGGAGNDVFTFFNAFGEDVITDFNANNLEDIDLSAVIAITSFTDLVSNHLSNNGGFAQIYVGANTLLLQGVAFADVGVGQLYSADDFIF